MTAVQTLQRYTATKTFRLGIGVAGVVYAGLFGYAVMQGGDDTVHKLASQTVTIERVAATTAEPAHAAETHETPDTVPQPVPVAEQTNSVALPKAPIDGLYEDTVDGGRLPKIRETDQMTPFAAYRRPYAPTKPEKPTVSIAVVDYGLSDIASKATLSDLSPEVSVILSPYSKTADYWLNEARDQGHEVWMALPVETDLYPRDDAGPQTLIIGAIAKMNMNKLNWALSRTQGYAGLATLYQPTFMKSAIDAKPIMDEIYKRGLGFVDGDTQPSDTPKNIANETNSPYNHADVWIDIPATPEHVAASLKQLEVLARTNGSATGFISSTPTGLKALQTWIDGLAQKDLAIAPLSAQTQKAK